MKRLIFLSLFASSLSAISIGRDGAAFEREEISWQPVKLVDNNAGFTATLPGEPRSGLSNGFIYSASKHNNVWYEVHTTFGSNYKCPKSEKAFNQKDGKL